MEFSAEQKTKISSLMSRGFSQPLAEMTVAAEAAGYKDAQSTAAGLVKALTGNEGRSKANVETERKRLQDELKKLEGVTDPFKVQQRIAIKNALSRLDRA